MLIGVFDSGIGGLTVLRAIREAWPGHSTLYLGDTARVPYGSKSAATVVRYARQNTRFLLDQGVDLLVVACNTASAYAMDSLAGLPAPVVGVIEPGARAAAAGAAASHIGVIGTAATIRSGAYERALARLRPGVRISVRACPLFVPLVEEGWEATPIARAIAAEYLADWLPGAPDRPDTLVLGCTHYPVLRPMLAELLGPEVRLIDAARATAAAVAPWLGGAAGEAVPRHRLFVTDGAEGFARAGCRLLGQENVELEVVDMTPLAAD
ncbi:MAG: glutamate racemase [bacterium]|nr:glutamate racemase [bacterium]